MQNKVFKSFATSTLLFSAFSVSSLNAAAIDLDLPATGNYTTTIVATSVTDASGATFDISYTLGANAIGANPFARSNSTQIGVGSDTDISAHYTTLEGNDGEGLSFTSLSVSNFVANGSGYVIGDIELNFQSLLFNNVANNQDGVNISFTSFGDAGAANQNLNAASTGGTPYTLDLTALANYSATATGLYIENDNTSSSNRWAIEGLQANYVIPEASSFALLAGLLGLTSVMLRRRKA
ncbi:MAG: hypothetical protein ACSHX8_05765 [Opitutaceae bacterium]